MKHDPISYRRSALRIVFGLLGIWFLASFGASILVRDWLDGLSVKVGNASLGFWMSQQGSIIVFILLLIVYRFMMNRLDARHGLVEND